MILKLIEPVFLGAIAIALATSCGFMCKTDILWPVPAGATADAAMRSDSVVLTPGVDYSESAATGGGIVTGELKKWHKVEISFSGPSTNESASSPNPFLDYRLDVFFTSPSNMVSEVPGFYAGDGKGGGRGDVWMVRFSPDEPGEWAYRARFRTGVNVAVASHPVAGSPASFDGASGTFEVAPLDPSAEGFLKWGRLEYVGEHYLKFRGGGYFIKSGINSPETFLSYVGFDNTPRAKLSYSAHKDDWDDGDPVFNSNGSDEGKGIIGAINYLSSVGVNSVYFLPMNIGGDGQDVAPYVSVNLWSGGDGASDNSGNDNLHFDISKLHQWNTLFEHAQKKGVMLHVVLSEAEAPNKRELDNAVLGRERKLYYRELVARFGYLLALQWNLCEEYDLGLNLGVTKVSEWGNWLHALDPYKHPVTVHNANSELDAVYRPFLGQPWLGTTSIQDTGIDPGSVVEDLRTWSRAAGRPVAVSLDEMVQQSVGSGVAIDALRKQQMYPIYLSGGAGLELHVGGFDLTLQNFRQSVNGQSLDALWRQLAVARRFVVQSLPFWEMEPDDGLLTGERGTGHVFAKPFAVYAVYLPEGGSANLDLSLVFGSFEQRWFNPRTGAFEGPAMTVAAGNNVSLGTPPASPTEDWIVLLETTDPGNKPRVLYPVADLYFEDGVKKAGEPVMKVQYDDPERIAVIKFDASDARPPVQSATLFLRCVVDGGQPRLRFYKALNPDFTEESISTVPAYGGQVASSDEAFAPNSGYYAFDVSDAIDGSGDIAFVIKGANPSPGSDAWFATTEDGGNSPRLHIVDSSVTDPTPTATSTPTPTATGMPTPTATLTPTPTSTPRTVNSYYLPMVPVALQIDGEINEWDAVPAVVLDIGTADYVHQRRAPDPADASAILRSGWDDGSLYFAIEVHDDALVADSEDIWRDDSVELGIDGLYDQVGWRNDDHHLVFGLDGRVAGFGLAPDAVTAVARTVRDGWVLEAAVAAEGLGAGPLTKDKVVGFTFGLRDDDDGGDWDGYLIWERDSTSDSSIGYGRLLLKLLPASLGGLAWNDADADGTQDATETGLSGVALSLRHGGDTVVSSTTTDADGFCSFDGLSPGTYTVVAVRPPGYRLTTPAAVVRELEPGEEYLAVRFGFVATTAVALVSFQADVQPEGVVITWSTFGERGITGFTLQRALSQSGPWLDVTDEPVPARGMIGLASSYQVVDADVESGFTYYYRLVTRPGMQEFGPISVSVLQIQWELGLGIQ